MCQFPKLIHTAVPSSEVGFQPRAIWLKVPCGKCLECKQQRSKEWAFRLEQEMKDWQHCAFITLTYDDDNLPVYNSKLGFVVRGRHNKGMSTLYKRDLTLFLKRLRYKEYGIFKFKYFAIGEYGFNGTCRPHYHILLFYNGPRPEKLYTTIAKVWDSGRISCTSATFGRLSYCSKYCSNGAVGCRHRFQTPYMVCSNRAPIGYNWLSSDLAMACFIRGEKVINRSYVKKDGTRVTYKMRIPRFYLRKMQMNMIYEELVKVNEEQSLLNLFGFKPSRRKLWNGLEVDSDYLAKCEETYKSFVRSHSYRDEEQHINMSFPQWFDMYHDFIFEENKRKLLSSPKYRLSILTKAYYEYETPPF